VKLQHRFSVPAARDQVWAVFKDVPAVAACVPGVEELVEIDASHYRGRFGIGVGPIRLSLEGEIDLEILDEAAGRALLRANGADRRLGGGVRALVTLSVAPTPGGGTDVVMDSDVQILGRIGELGQPIMKRKADEVMGVFARRLAERLAPPGVS
jgi:carbon monoxide dehydrogenase subunit G